MWGRWHGRGWQGEGGEGAGVQVQWVSPGKAGRGVGVAKEGVGKGGALQMIRKRIGDARSAISKIKVLGPSPRR